LQHLWDFLTRVYHEFYLNIPFRTFLTTYFKVYISKHWFGWLDNSSTNTQVCKPKVELTNILISRWIFIETAADWSCEISNSLNLMLIKWIKASLSRLDIPSGSDCFNMFVLSFFFLCWKLYFGVEVTML
jgi:hypothetical protein